MSSKEEILAEIAELTARKARVDDLHQEWNRLSADSQSAAAALALTAWQPRKAQEAFAKYRDACKTADLVYANMMDEMGDRRFLDDIEAEQRQSEAVTNNG